MSIFPFDTWQMDPTGCRTNSFLSLPYQFTGTDQWHLGILLDSEICRHSYLRPGLGDVSMSCSISQHARHSCGLSIRVLVCLVDREPTWLTGHETELQSSTYNLLPRRCLSPHPGSS